MNNSNDLAKLVTKTVSFVQNKFQDPDTNKSPHFMLSFSMNKEGFTGAIYTPILNHLGFDSYLFFQNSQGGIVMPWTYEDTFRYLKDFPENESVDSLIFDSQDNWNAIIGGTRAGQIIFIQNNSVLTPTPVISGGTRKGTNITSVKMRRPWQPNDLEHNLETCPLCNKPQIDESTVEKGNIKSFTNPATPYNFHKMIVPTKEFYSSGKDDQKYLTDSNSLIEVLRIAYDLFSQSNLDTSDLGVHQGYLGGQNLAHLHFHLVHRN